MIGIKNLIGKLLKTKFMATVKLAGDTPKQVYQTASNNYYFVKDKNKKHSIISPYYIVTDGHDICGFLDNNANFQIGNCFVIKKKGIFSRKKSKEIFESVLDKSVRAHFLSSFDICSTEDGKEYPLLFNDFSVHNTETAIYSSPFTNDSHVIHPILFLILPNNKKIKINKTMKYLTVLVSIEDCFKNGASVSSDNYATKIIGLLVANDEIALPVISGSNQWCEKI